ncbi:hypothetical protein AVEN_66812-1 [Araneus ventricosus]|uniref:Uncharacterized protein n=1 Tax=Araneus ventricosus TaxID=182803 RepID=A0A4Y2DNV2_ARAVE|nr:hypothetical protein AVEN_66812-1 [Araneus ventricosus]
MVRLRPLGWRVAGLKPDSTEDPPCMGSVARSIIPKGPNVFPLVRKFGEGASSSSDCDSKLRALSQNSLRVALKRNWAREFYFTPNRQTRKLFHIEMLKHIKLN